MSILIIDEATKERIKEVKDYAERNHYSFDDLLDIKNGAQEPPGDNAFYSCHLSEGYRVVYIIEDQPSVGLLRHISVSLNEQLPSVPSVKLIMEEFGFETPLEECYVYLEDTPTGKAINVLEVYNG